MEETTVSIIGILIASIIMFVVPLMMISDRTDDIAQLVVQTATEEFIDDVIKTGKLTDERYKQFNSSLVSSGNSYEIDMEIKFLDENTLKRLRAGETVGANSYYSIFTNQIEDKIKITTNNPKGELILKQGDEISVTVKNNSATFSQSLKSFYYNPGSKNSHIIVGTATGTVAINGST